MVEDEQLSQRRANVFQFFHSFFDAKPPRAGAIESASIRAAVERVVDGVDPRLRAVPHYQRTLWQPVERAVTYLTESVKGLPPAIPFDRRRSQVDPRLRALFLGPDHVLETLSASAEVRGYLEQRRPAAAGAVCGVACGADRADHPRDVAGR